MTDDEARDAIRKFQEDPVFEKLESSIDIAIRGLNDLMDEEDRKVRRWRIIYLVVGLVGVSMMVVGFARLYLLFVSGS